MREGLKMPNVQKTKLNKGAILAFLLIAVIVGSLFLSISWYFKVLIDLVAILCFVFFRRGYIYFYKGAVLLQKENSPKVWKYLHKALNANVDDERKILICSAFIQQNDVQFGIDTLEKLLISCKDENRRATAIITLSMGYWALGNLDHAIELLQNLSATGYKDDNLEVNLETYLLEKGDLKEAKKIISQSRKNSTENNGLLDNRGWYYIQKGEWDKARNVFDELINDRNAKFPVAYVHGAQVSVHFGRIEEAIDRLGWGLSKKFTNTSMVEKKYVQTLLDGLENPKTRDLFAKSMDSHAYEVSIGHSFDGFENALTENKNENKIANKTKGETKDEIKANKLEASKTNSDKTLLSSKTNPIAQEDVEDLPNTSIDDLDDEREPNTELTEADFLILSQSEEETNSFDFDEDSILDTSVDDDEREPNTDLTDEDEDL